MAAKKFGATWWGSSWLKALSHIDYSNRLPRGARYARSGSVKSIDIAHNEINAKVQGRRPSPYRITISAPVFSQRERQKIKAIITANPFYMSQLAVHKLPETLLDDLTRAGVALFPKSWRDLDMHCSCPDWAVPCKHLAAVIYIVANEIDKNPFLVFHLHNYDLLSDLTKVLDTVSDASGFDDIPTVASLLEKSGQEAEPRSEDFFERAAQIGFSQIPPLAQDILSILSDNPLFAPEGTFKTLLHKMYRFTAAEVKRVFSRRSEEPLVTLQAVEIKQVTFSEDLRDVTFSLKSPPKHDTIAFETLDDWQEFVGRTDFSQLRDYPEAWTVVWLCFSFALRLLQEGAYIPQVIRAKDGTYGLRWIPALFNEEVANIFDEIAALTPSKWLRVKQGRKHVFPAPTEAALMLISAFLTRFVRLFGQSVTFSRDRAVAHFFFRDNRFKSTCFEEAQIPQTIHLWLSRFYIVHRDIAPVIKIDEQPRQNQFLFEILVDTHADTADTLTALSDVLSSPAYQDVRMQILKDLSLLSDYLPPVNSYLETNAAKPVKIRSDAFVSVWFDSLPILNVLGIKTIIPKSLRSVIVPQLALAAGSDAKKLKNVKSYLDLASLLRFRWQIAIGDAVVNPDEFFQQVERLSGIVKYRDQYIFIDKKEMEKLLKASHKDAPDFSPIDMLRINLEERYKDMPVIVPEQIKNTLNKMLKVKTFKLPKSLQADLRPYQERGFRWLYHNSRIGFGSIIADDMGLGKTVQVIALLLKQKEAANPKHPSLAIVPTTLLTNWEHECRKFAPSLTTSIYHGPARQLETDCDLVLTTYAIARNEVSKLKKLPWHALILDEAQNIKNATAKQTQAIKSLPAQARIAMTGTPVENSLMEYWSIMDFLNKGLLGTVTGFKKDFATPIEKFRDRERLDRFLTITSPFIMRRVKTDKSIIQDLPDKIRIDEYCTLTTEQAALYQNIVEQTMDAIEGAEGIERKGLVLKLILALKQICNHPCNYLKSGKRALDRSGKALLLTNLLEKILTNREKCLIFTQYKAMGDLLQEMLGREFNTEVIFLHGGVTRKKRDAMVQAFQQDHRTKLFILSLKAGGTGLNLTAANHVVHYDLWWNPAVEVQATDRAYRIGQEKNVNVYRLITEATFEEKINDLLASKQELFNLSVKQGETWITEMSNDELKNLVSLE